MFFYELGIFTLIALSKSSSNVVAINSISEGIIFQLNLHDLDNDFHKYSLVSVTPASMGQTERTTISLRQWLLCVVGLFISPCLF